MNFFYQITFRTYLNLSELIPTNLKLTEHIRTYAIPQCESICVPYIGQRLGLNSSKFLLIRSRIFPTKLRWGPLGQNISPSFFSGPIKNCSGFLRPQFDGVGNKSFYLHPQKPRRVHNQFQTSTRFWSFQVSTETSATETSSYLKFPIRFFLDQNLYDCFRNSITWHLRSFSSAGCMSKICLCKRLEVFSEDFSSTTGNSFWILWKFHNPIRYL